MILLIWIKFPGHISPKHSCISIKLPPNFTVGAIHDSFAIKLNRQSYFCLTETNGILIRRFTAPFSTHWHSNFYVCLSTMTFSFYYHIYEWLFNSHSTIKGSTSVLQLLEILCFLWKSLNQPSIRVLVTIYSFLQFNESLKITIENSLRFWRTTFSRYSHQVPLSFLKNTGHYIWIFSINFIH